MSNSDKRDRLVWMDMEMTGLDPQKEGIIEMATVITDGKLRLIARGPNLIIHQPKKLLDKMDEWNQNQHGKSGLLAKVKRSKITVKKAEKLTLDFLKKYCHKRQAPLCGNSIHHDRSFLVKYMPKLNQHLHYRLVDVSSIKELIKRWYPNRNKDFRKKENHRALDDILESIAELKFYRKLFFK